MVSNSITNAKTSTQPTSDSVTTNPKSILGKDDFMKLLLTELKYQDPTSPMDTEKMLTQTSQLATLESADNTKKALEKLTSQLSASANLGIVGAIGKMASLGKDTILVSKDNNPSFDLYFKHDIQSGTVKIKDKNGNLVKTLTLQPQKGGVLNFNWDGTDDSGKRVPEGEYSISADYSDGNSGSYTTAFGKFPIESVKFDKGDALLKLGNSYYALSKIKEISK